MLGKLFKYEFSATGRIFLPMYAALLVMSVIARIFYTSNIRSDIATMLITMLLVMLFTAVWVVTLVIIVRRFWSNLLGREGYLMNVLPVNPWEHVLAKTVTSGVWVIAGMIVSTAAFLIMLFGLSELADVDWRVFFSDFSKFISYLRDENLAGPAVLAIVQFVLLMVVCSFEFVLTAYAAMCIGQLANNHRTLASIGAYFGLDIVQSLITNLANEGGYFNIVSMVPSGTDYTEYARRSLVSTNQFMALLLLLTAAICAAMFFVSSILLKKKLNLQ